MAKDKDPKKSDKYEVDNDPQKSKHQNQYGTFSQDGSVSNDKEKRKKDSKEE